MAKVHRVAFAGASGTGKTTLAKWLEESYALPFNPVGSRTIAKEMGFDSAYAANEAGKRAEFQLRLVQEKTRWEAEHNEFVTDRTPFDNLVYSMMYNAETINEQLFDLACQGMSRYEYVVYCPVSVFIRIDNDPTRLENLTYQKLYDAALWGMLQRFRSPEVRLVQLPYPNLDHRKDFLRALMKPT